MLLFFLSSYKGLPTTVSLLLFIAAEVLMANLKLEVGEKSPRVLLFL
jgi:hypothetical protein